jgi:hypothetical protein
VRSDAPVTCLDVAERLAGAVDGALSLDPAARAHVEGCGRCQAEVAADHRLRLALRRLRSQMSDPAPGLLDDLLAAVDGQGPRRPGRWSGHGRRVAYVGGVAAAATAAGVGGAMVLANRSRRRLPALR